MQENYLHNHRFDNLKLHQSKSILKKKCVDGGRDVPLSSSNTVSVRNVV